MALKSVRGMMPVPIFGPVGGLLAFELAHALRERGVPQPLALFASGTAGPARRDVSEYAIAAAVGKLGAFVGTYVFPYIVAAGGDSEVLQAQYPFWVSSSLCVLSAGLVLFFLPHIGQDTITLEDAKFRKFLEENGYDTRQLGLKKGESLETVEHAHVKGESADSAWEKPGGSESTGTQQT